jgi:hypothetical protein
LLPPISESALGDVEVLRFEPPLSRERGDAEAGGFEFRQKAREFIPGGIAKRLLLVGGVHAREHVPESANPVLRSTFS